MKIIIIGCGRVGAKLANDFAEEGHHVSVVDQRQTAFRRLPSGFRGQLVLGTGIDEDVLRNAGIQQADVFIAVTENDNTNIMAAQIAQVIYRVPKVILRIYDPDRAEIYRELGLTVICPTRTVAEMIEHAVRDHVVPTEPS
ncbi:TrkA family potassium uptake protein [Thermomicrobium sp. CFH 73360]|uniref:potassium channel family protein n=1 Tax=Thermomicrobium sp. CFH 73360 TaxID=2951987 RepID=UPI0020777CEC|nr:TrkA family potassium uptake protein [Thermomicrobium sp. CFH 73360]